MKLTADKMIYGGAALARHDGKAVFVRGALPGEVVDVAITRQKSGFAEASVVDVLTPAAERVSPGCPYFGVCGGCQYQHAQYAAQLEYKCSILAETLTRAGLQGLPEIAVHAAKPWGYRNRIRLHVDPRTHAVGYLRARSHQLLPVCECPIAAPVLNDALRALAALAQASALGSWCAEAELFTNEDGSVLLTMHGRAGVAGARKRVSALCEALAAQLPQLAGASWTAAETPGTASQVPVRWGTDHVRYTVGAHSYRVSAGAFFQGNRFLVERLAQLATDEESGGTAWDLYAGVGLFARRLAERFERVVAVEGSPVSSADLRDNLPAHTVRAQSTLHFLQQVRERPDLVVLDPPRAGLGAEAAQQLARIGPPAVTYVSCDPATLARDLVVLVHAGYTLTALALVDMFPQTFHLETVVTLRLG